MSNTNRGDSKVSFWKKIFYADAVENTDTAENMGGRLKKDSSAAEPWASATTMEQEAKEETASGMFEAAADQEEVADDGVDNLDTVEQKDDITLAEQEEQNLEQSSADFRYKAGNILNVLAATEKEYSEAKLAAAAAEQKAATVTSEQEAYLADIAANNKIALDQAAEKVAAAEQLLADKHRELADLAKETDEAVLLLTQTQEQEQADVNARLAAVRVSITNLRQFKTKVEYAERSSQAQLSELEAAAATLQKEYDKAAKELTALEYQYQQKRYQERLEAILRSGKEEQNRLHGELTELDQAFTEKQQQIEKEINRLTAEIESRKNNSAAEAQKKTEADESYAAAEKEYHRLQEEQAAIVKESESEIEFIMGRIDDARKDVDAKKAAYAEAQEQVKTKTAISVKANAQAAAAKEKSDKAAIEKADAATAAEMAQKLKSDATVARVNTDDASSLLLSRAEMVLVNTAEKAMRLLEEKTSLYELAEQDAIHFRSEADLAAAEAKRAADVADKMISQWLAAEENLVKITTAAEAEKQEVENKTAQVLERYKQNIEDVKQTMMDCQKNSADASAARTQDDEALVELEKACSAATASLSELEERYHEDKRKTENELTEAIARTDADSDSCNREMSDFSAQIENRKAACAKQQQALETAVTARDSFSQQFAADHRKWYDDLASYESVVFYAQDDHQAACGEMKERMESCFAQLQLLRLKQGNMDMEIAHLSSDYQAAVNAQTQQNADLTKHLSEAQKQADKEINAANAAAAAAKKHQQDIYGSLKDYRAQADAAVEEAVTASLQRLQAVNKVACLTAQKELDEMDKRIIAATETAADVKNALDKTEFANQTALKEVNENKTQKAELIATYNQKAQEIDSQKDAEISILSEQIDFLTKIDEQCRSSLSLAERSLAAVENDYAIAQQRLEQAQKAIKTVHEKSQTQFEQLEENYLTALDGADQEIPQLRSQYEQCRHTLHTAEEEYAAAAKEWQQQQAVAEQAIEEETTVKQQSEQALSELSQRSENAISELHNNITQMETHKGELDSAHNNLQAAADKSESAYQEAEKYLQRIIDEEEKERNYVDKELARINNQLKLLQEDADSKAQKYREISATLKESPQLLQAAQENLDAAQKAFNFAEADLRTAESTYQTSLALADQASKSYQSVDNETATILKRASEELVIAADNAAVVVEEKKKIYLDAEESLRVAKKEFKKISKTVTEAPHQADSSKVVWLKADEEYKKFKQEAEQQIPALKEALASFLAERAAAKASAHAAVERCLRERDDAKHNLEVNAQSIVDALAEIARLGADKKSLEQRFAQEKDQLQSSVNKNIQEKQLSRENAISLAGRLKSTMLACASAHDSAKDNFAEAERRYRQACAKLNENYQDDKENIEKELAKVRKNLANEQFSFNAVTALKDHTEQNLDQAKNCYDDNLAQREQALAVKEQLIAERELLLNELAAEKQQRLEDNIVAYLAANEKAAKTNNAYLAQKILFAQVDKELQNLIAARETLAARLSLLQDEQIKLIAFAEGDVLHNIIDDQDM